MNTAKYIDVLEALEKFAIGKERDAQLMEHVFNEWKEANILRVGHDKRHLGKDLARVLDGATIQHLAKLKDESEPEKINTQEPPSQSCHLRHLTYVPPPHSQQQPENSHSHPTRSRSRRPAQHLPAPDHKAHHSGCKS